VRPYPWVLDFQFLAGIEQTMREAYIEAFGKALEARTTRESGVGEPPNNRPSSGYPTRELSTRSATIEGTLGIREGDLSRYLKNRGFHILTLQQHQRSLP